MERCEIFKTNNDYRIGTMGINNIGIGISTHPYFILSINSSFEDMYEKINMCLKESVQKVNDDNIENAGKRFLKGLGFKNYSELHKKALCCLIERDEKAYYFVPTKNEIREKNFIYLPDKQKVLSIHEPKEKIIKELLAAFDLCE